MNVSHYQWAIIGVLVFSRASLWAQAPPPDVEQMQKDAQLLFEDLKSHRQQIEQQTVDDLTIQLQDEILTVWDRLLDQADQQNKKPQSKPQQNQQPQNQNQQEQDQSSQQPQSQQPMGKEPMPQQGDEPQSSQAGAENASGEESQEPADRASEETRERQQGRLLEMQREERERLMKEVWGKLPERIRQKLLNASDEQYLPAYEDRIREYFRKLSEPESR
ncbi:MAG: hypothetical protein HUJ26_14105 [Planctomycetaceae bacterium]|nr:hypothetical protein [Planctomycetaceae bacterium]